MEPACAVLDFAVSTYYAVKKRGRGTAARQQRDGYLKKGIVRVWASRKIGRELCGARKVWRRLGKDGIGVARCTVERLMRELGIAG